MNMKVIYFPSRPDCPEFYDKGLKNQPNRLFIGSVYAEVNQQIQCFAYVKRLSGSISHPYIQFQTLDPFRPPQKKTSN